MKKIFNHHLKNKLNQLWTQSTAKAATIKVEIWWVLKCVASGFIDNSCSDYMNLFASKFPDSKVAKCFKLGPDEIRYILSFGIAFHFKDL